MLFFQKKQVNVKNMKRVLVVDDEEDIVDFVKEAIESHYLVEGACGGMECLSKFSDFKPDLLLLDIMMPRMSGWELLEELDRKGLSEETKVAMLTAKPLAEEDMEKRVFNQLVHYIRKPLRVGPLLKEIGTIFRDEELLAEEVERISQSFGKEFANTYHDFFSKAARRKRIFAHVIKKDQPPAASWEKERLLEFVGAIEDMEGKLYEMKLFLKQLLRKK